MKSVSTLVNIGESVTIDLAKIGIFTVDDFKARSVYEVYFLMQSLDKKWKNKMLLYALFGAMNDVNCMNFDAKTKEFIVGEYERYINNEDE